MSFVMRLLLDARADPDARCKHKTTPFLSAAEHGHTNTVEMLLRTGKVELNWRDGDGETALYMAVNAGHEDTVRVLLTGGVDPNAKSSRGSPPSIRAAQHGDEAILRLLLDAGAD